MARGFLCKCREAELKKTRYCMPNYHDARSEVDCRQARGRGRRRSRMMITFTYSYRSKYSGSFAPLFPSSLETLGESVVLGSNVAVFFFPLICFFS
jgi:hypothetical protein